MVLAAHACGVPSRAEALDSGALGIPRTWTLFKAWSLDFLSWLVCWIVLTAISSFLLFDLALYFGANLETFPLYVMLVNIVTLTAANYFCFRFIAVPMLFRRQSTPGS